jgi:hypothetical protein
MKNLGTLLISILIINSQIALGQTGGELIIPLSSPGKPAKVKVDLKKGSITIKGTSRQDVKVIYTGRDNDKGQDKASADGLKKITSANLDLEASENKNFVDIDSDSWKTAIDLVIEVPQNVDLDVSTYNSGDIMVENITGEVVADNYNGKITLSNIAGSAMADTYNGDIKVILTKVTPPDTPMSFISYNGVLDITMPANTKGNLKMRTRQGDIFSGFEMKVVEMAPVQKKDAKNGVYKVYLDDWTRGSINGGGPEFTMKTYNGDIYIRTL